MCHSTLIFIFLAEELGQQIFQVIGLIEAMFKRRGVTKVMLVSTQRGGTKLEEKCCLSIRAKMCVEGWCVD